MEPWRQEFVRAALAAEDPGPVNIKDWLENNLTLDTFKPGSLKPADYQKEILARMSAGLPIDIRYVAPVAKKAGA